MKKPCIIAAGILFLFIGLIGLLLPVMPTVPFLVIAISCFSKGSERFRLWFEQRRIYKYIRRFVETESRKKHGYISLG